MGEGKGAHHTMAALFTMVTFLIYALALMLFVSLGASVYRSVTERMETHRIQRTAESYLREKLRQNDRMGAVSIREIQGQQALEIAQEIDGKKYVTYLYAWDGMLRELVISAEKEVRLSEGTGLVRMEAVTFQAEETGQIVIGLQLQEGKYHTFTVRSMTGLSADEQEVS